MNPDWDRQVIVDWVLTFVAAIVAASLLAGSNTPRSSEHASVSAVRELEFRAQMQKYPTLREEMGVGELDMLTETLDELVGSDMTSADHLLVIGTLALVIERKQYTLEALDQLTEKPQMELERVSQAAIELSDLAKERAGPLNALKTITLGSKSPIPIKLKLSGKATLNDDDGAEVVTVDVSGSVGP